MLFRSQTSTLIQSGPWEWYDSLSLVLFSQAIGQPAAGGTQAYMNGLATNPDMSKAKALAYIDTIQNYLNPRIARCLGLFTGMSELDQERANIGLYPNPSNGQFTIDLSNVGNNPKYIRIADLSGRVVSEVKVQEKTAYAFRGIDLSSGLYLVKIGFDGGEIAKKLVIN